MFYRGRSLARGVLLRAGTVPSATLGVKAHSARSHRPLLPFSPASFSAILACPSLSLPAASF